MYLSILVCGRVCMWCGKFKFVPDFLKYNFVSEPKNTHLFHIFNYLLKQ